MASAFTVNCLQEYEPAIAQTAALYSYYRTRAFARRERRNSRPRKLQVFALDSSEVPDAEHSSNGGQRGNSHRVTLIDRSPTALPGHFVYNRHQEDRTAPTVSDYLSYLALFIGEGG
jgi:hypothetical protein